MYNGASIHAVAPTTTCTESSLLRYVPLKNVEPSIIDSIDGSHCVRLEW